MEKINFVNGTTIDGASTFNAMQQNIENAINGVVETGSNNNGSYIKFSDGTMIAHDKKYAVSNLNNAFGTWFSSEDITFPDFAVPFKEPPEVTFNFHRESWSWRMLVMETASSTTTNAGAVQYVSPSGNAPNAQGGYVGYMAIGRWK